MAVATFVNGQISHTAWVPWVLLLTTFAIWGAWSILSNLFGGLAARASGAAVGAGAGGAVAGAPGAAVGGVAGAGSPWYGRTHDTTHALRDLLWLMLIPVLFNTFFGWEETAKNLIIAIFVLGLIWAFLRGLFHRFADLLWIPLIAMSIAAAALAIDGDHADH